MKKLREVEKRIEKKRAAGWRMIVPSVCHALRQIERPAVEFGNPSKTTLANFRRDRKLKTPSVTTKKGVTSMFETGSHPTKNEVAGISYFSLFSAYQKKL